MNKIMEFLSRLFSPRITRSYRYTKITELPEEFEQGFEKMSEAFDLMGKGFDKVDKHKNKP